MVVNDYQVTAGALADAWGFYDIQLGSGSVGDSPYDMLVGAGGYDPSTQQYLYGQLFSGPGVDVFAFVNPQGRDFVYNYQPGLGGDQLAFFGTGGANNEVWLEPTTATSNGQPVASLAVLYGAGDQSGGIAIVVGLASYQFLDLYDNLLGVTTVSLQNIDAPVSASLADGNWHGFDGHTHVANLVGSNYGSTLTGDNLANVLTGGVGNDVLDGGGGNDTLIGGGGYDLYRFDAGYGQDLIVNGIAGQGGPAGELDFGPQMAPDNVWLDQVDSAGTIDPYGSDLRFTILGTASSATIQNWFNDGAAQLSREVLATSQLALDASVGSLLQAMSSYEANYFAATGTAFDPSIAAATITDPTVLAAVSTAWHH